MRKLEIKDADIMRISVQQEILRSDESRYDHKLHGILLVSSGTAAPKLQNYSGTVREPCNTGSIVLSKAVLQVYRRFNGGRQLPWTLSF